jgi:hypothetical protein
MRTWITAAALVLTAGTSGCATKPFDFSEFQKAPPRSILIVPVVNRSLDVDASNYVLSTLTVPLAELGYYVFPVNTVKIVLEHEGFYEPEQIRTMDTAQLANLFGADAVLYVTINRWDAQYIVISTTVTVEFDYVMKRKDGTQIWHANKRMQYSPQQQQGGASPLATLVAQMISAAMTRAAPNYLPLTQQANTQVFQQDSTKLPRGPYVRVIQQ